MSADDPTDREQSGPQAPPALVADLRAAFGATDPIPADVERAVLQAGRQRAERLGGPRRTWRPRWIAVAAAAAVVLVLLNLPTRQPAPEAELAAQPAATPVFEEAREVDVLHAFQLARLLDEGRTDLAGRGWDRNGDGRVDDADVEALLDLAVRIDRS